MIHVLIIHAAAVSHLFTTINCNDAHVAVDLSGCSRILADAFVVLFSIALLTLITVSCPICMHAVLVVAYLRWCA